MSRNNKPQKVTRVENPRCLTRDVTPRVNIFPLVCSLDLLSFHVDDHVVQDPP